MTSRKKIKIAVPALIVFVIGFSAILIYPLFGDVKNISRELVSQKRASFSVELKVKKLEEFDGKYSEIEPNLEKASALFADKDLPVDFIRYLETTASASKISIKISPYVSGKIPQDLWPSFMFQIGLTGPFANVLKFIDKLESDGYLVGAENLSVVRLEANELKSDELKNFSAGDVKVGLSIKVFTR